ncbi:hypothetical protein N7481_008039 [Penicillium waksmanii]|uniref:uncharacterized protein n=1 Tax=Penicillium waksmanii TaxID=69791 RepID=UPI0025466AD9|nr:uncharacterized protein N7481_008039 [Penicillium waksmanii]KAJ5980741.1 hypothetical protein N7481_008039 [Penicillium waksmanii]
MSLSREMSPDPKTKIRPQQSCVRCRERKVKCDRSRPCQACIIRGLEAECTYLATAEDHAQINQAEIIDRLRREVAQLRGQLNQGPRQAPSPGTVRRRHDYARKYGGGAASNASASASASSSRNGYAGNRMAQRQSNAGGSVNGVENEGSWAGSSPSSSTTTMTNSNSVTMTSPDSTGSENGSTRFSYPAAGPYGTSVVAEAEGAGAFGELSYSTNSDEVTVAYCQPELPTFGEIPSSAPLLQGIVSQPIMHPDASQFQGISPMQLNGPYGDAQSYIYEKPDPQSQSRPQPHTYPWGHDAMGSQFSAPYSDSSSHLASINPFDAQANAQTTSPPNPNSNSLFQTPPAPPPINQHQQHPHHHQHQLDPLQRELTPNPIDSIPDSWKIEGKEELLETLLQTISSCDEKSVAQVVSVVRASATPEAAVSGICQVLGISGISGQ